MQNWGQEKGKAGEGEESLLEVDIDASGWVGRQGKKGVLSRIRDGRGIIKSRIGATPKLHRFNALPARFRKGRSVRSERVKVCVCVCM